MIILKGLLKNTYESIPKIPDESLVLNYKNELMVACYKQSRFSKVPQTLVSRKAQFINNKRKT